MAERQKDGEIERQRGRKRQKETERDRKRDRATQRHIGREAERQSDRTAEASSLVMDSRTGKQNVNEHTSSRLETLLKNSRTNAEHCCRSPMNTSSYKIKYYWKFTYDR